GGTSVNSIPESATMRVDLRSMAAAEIERMETDLRKAVARAALEGTAPGIAQVESAGALRYEFKRIGERPAAELPAAARILHIVRAVDSHLAVASQLHCSSTDANIPLALGREAVCIGTGGAGGSAHTLNEWYDPSGRELGLKRILLAALALAGMESQ
ncbi:MAG: M20/M25/M40 family metallo-hydrolase, partial [Candidatus Acidiferrum sp.]